MSLEKVPTIGLNEYGVRVLLYKKGIIVNKIHVQNDMVNLLAAFKNNKQFLYYRKRVTMKDNQKDRIRSLKSISSSTDVT